MAINYILKANNSHLCNGKYFPKVVGRSNITTNKLANMIEAQCSATKSDVVAVLSALTDIMQNELQNGNKVLLDGIGYFWLTIKATGAETEESFNANKNIKGVKCNFLPVGTRDTDNSVSRAFISGVKFQRLNLSATTSSNDGDTDVDTNDGKDDTTDKGTSDGGNDGLQE
jgi:predicted histone-like DNA-binding protein